MPNTATPLLYDRWKRHLRLYIYFFPHLLPLPPVSSLIAQCLIPSLRFKVAIHKYLLSQGVWSLGVLVAKWWKTLGHTRQIIKSSSGSDSLMFIQKGQCTWINQCALVPRVSGPDWTLKAWSFLLTSLCCWDDLLEKAVCAGRQPVWLAAVYVLSLAAGGKKRGLWM